MIRIKQAKAFCREDISLIENYDLAIADQTQYWDCHHRNGIQFSRDELKAMGLYWKRPASELIFLTRSEHSRLHAIGNQYTKGKHWKISNPRTGENHPMYGKHLTEEHKNKLRGKTPWNKGKPTSPETRTKLSESHRGEKNPRIKAVYQIDKTTGEIIKKWNYIKEAANALGISSNHISYCCKGKLKSTGGFRWRYVD